MMYARVLLLGGRYAEARLRFRGCVHIIVALRRTTRSGRVAMPSAPHCAGEIADRQTDDLFL